MQFIRTDIPDVVIIEPKVHGDERGYFVETFRADKLEAFLNKIQKITFDDLPTIHFPTWEDLKEKAKNI